MGKSPREKNGLKKGPWTAEEDKLLVDYIQKHGHGRWRTLPVNAGLKRCGKSCRLRWINYLRPDIKRGKFSPEEEQTIIHLHSAWGNKWSAIAASLPGRTDNEIKNYWNTHIKKKLMRMGIDPVTHTPRFDLLNLYSILSSSLYHNSSNTPYSNLPNLHRIESIEPTQNFPQQQATATPSSYSQVINNHQMFTPNFQDYHVHSSQFTSPMSSPFLGHEINQPVEANVEKTLFAYPDDCTMTSTQEDNLTNTWEVGNETQILGDNYYGAEKYYNCQSITNPNLMGDEQVFQSDCTTVHDLGIGSSLSSSPRSSLAGFDSASTIHGWTNKSGGFFMSDDVRDSLASRIVQL